MKLPSKLLGAMILTAALGGLTSSCSPDASSTTATSNSATPTVSIDSAHPSPINPDSADNALQVNPPDSMHPDHPASFNCPACGKG